VVRKTARVFLLFIFSFGVLVAGNATAQGEEGFSRAAAPAIHVYANQSVILDSEFGIKRITIARPEIADVIVVSTRQMVIVGKTPGTTTLSYWNEADLPTTKNIVVGADLETVRAALRVLLCPAVARDLQRVTFAIAGLDTPVPINQRHPGALRADVDAEEVGH